MVKKTYLLSDPFPMEEITLSEVKYEVLKLLYKGGNPHSISKIIKKAKSTTLQHLQELAAKGLAQKGEKNRAQYADLWKITPKGSFLIEKGVGFSVKSTRVAERQSVKYLPSDFNRGHALQFKIALPNEWTNEERERILTELGIDFKRLNLFGGGHAIVFKHKKIHLTRSSVILYDSADYFAPTAVNSEDNAYLKTLYLIKDLERLLKVNWSFGNHYKIRISKRHHALIKNGLAQLYNTPKREKLEVYDGKGLWLLIDNSFNLNELEAVHSNTAVPDADGMRQIINSFKATDFKVTSDYILDKFKETEDRIKKVSEEALQISQVLDQLNKNDIKITKLILKDKK